MIKIINNDLTYVHYYDAKTCGDCKVCIIENETPNDCENSDKILFALFFRIAGLVKTVKLEGQRSITAM